MEEDFEVHKIVLPEKICAQKVLPRERVQLLTAEQLRDVPQVRGETVEMVNTTLQVRISERSEAISAQNLTPRKCGGGQNYHFQERISARSQLVGVPKTSCW